MPPRVPKPPRHPLTHFLCIPLVTPFSRPQLLTSLTSFRTDITKPTPENPDGIPEKAIRPIGTLHLTLGVMSLVTPERVGEALGVLRGLGLGALLMRSRGSRDEQTENVGSGGQEKEKGEREVGEPLQITLRGLESMHTPSKTSILYTLPVDPDSVLQRFCQNLRDIFVEKELMVKEERELLLHATLVNTVYVKGRGKGRGKKVVFDGSEFLERYEDVVWMAGVRVEGVRICRMGAKRREDGEEEYEVEGEVEMRV